MLAMSESSWLATQIISDGSTDVDRVEFELVNDRAVRFGASLEDEIEDYIWFDRVFDEDTMMHQVSVLCTRLPLCSLKWLLRWPQRGHWSGSQS